MSICFGTNSNGKKQLAKKICLPKNSAPQFWGIGKMTLPNGNTADGDAFFVLKTEPSSGSNNYATLRVTQANRAKLSGITLTLQLLTRLPEANSTEEHMAGKIPLEIKFD